MPIAVDYASLTAGDTVSDRSYPLSFDVVSSYVQAVEDEAWKPATSGNFVPPMAIAALGIRALVNDLQVPGGTVHVGQEVEFMGAVAMGDNLHYAATVLQNTVRRGQRFMSVSLSVADDSGRKVMAGKSTIVLPE